MANCQTNVSAGFLVIYYELPEDQCNRRVSKIHINDISRSACRKWRSLVAYLGMKEIVISDIEHESAHEEERRCNFFSLWRDENGDGATYMVLIDALLKIKCRSDAEYVCQLLQKSIKSPELPVSQEDALATKPENSSGPDDELNQDEVAADCFNPQVMEDLTHQLKCYRDQIQTEYAFFVSYVQEKIIEEEAVTAHKLRIFLLHLPALTCEDNEEHCKLLYGVKSEFQKATTVDDIFLLLSQFTSFLDYHIYLSIAARFKIDIEEEKTEYFKHLNEYVNKHRISDLIDTIPTLCKHCDQFTDKSKTLVFKLNIKMSCKFAELITLKSAVAKLLGFHPSALRLLSIKRGSVLVTFSVPAFATEFIFASTKSFTQDEKKQFRMLSVVWLECGGRRFNFDEETSESVEVNIPGCGVNELDQKLGSSDGPHSTQSSSRNRKFTLFQRLKISRHNLMNLTKFYRKILIRSSKYKYSHEQYTPDAPVTHHKPTNRLYEELPESVFMTAGHDPIPQYPYMRQNGIEYDPDNPKADNFFFHCSEDHDLSGLSGVTGNIPGAHKMPTYSHGCHTSVASEAYTHFPDTVSNPRHTQSFTIVPPTDASKVGNAYMPQYQRQNGIEYDHSSPKAENFSRYSSDNAHNSNDDGSDWMEASGNISGAHKMPTSSPEVPSQQEIISDMNLLTVMNCLMHNEDCEIVGCPCRQLQDRYHHLVAATVPSQQKNPPERKLCATPASSSSEDSDAPVRTSSRKAKMRLKLHDVKKLHPHYHLSKRSHHVGRVATGTISHRRSRSLSDLSPITEIRETPTPLIGQAIRGDTPIHCSRTLGDASSNAEELTPFSKAEEHALQFTPLLLREISISSDNIPVLCLNDCPLPPSPITKSKGGFSRLSSDKLPQVRTPSSMPRESFSGSQSDSAYETVTTVCDDGLVIETTEC